MPAKLMAVLGACKRSGRWEVSSQTKAFVLFGRCYIDYREAFADAEVENMKLSVMCLFGSATFIVPKGSDIQPSSVSLLASTAFDVPERDEQPQLPTLVIESTTLLGRCRVITTPPGEDEELEGVAHDRRAAKNPDSSEQLPVAIDQIGIALVPSLAETTSEEDQAVDSPRDPSLVGGDVVIDDDLAASTPALPPLPSEPAVPIEALVAGMSDVAEKAVEPPESVGDDDGISDVERALAQVMANEDEAAAAA